MLRELFENNKNIVINTDIDGFLSGMILEKYYGCKVVGFSDSRDTVWLIPEIKDIDSPIYIDLYVARPNVTCIEQHIIAFDKSHHNEIVSWGTKINPNLARERTFTGDMSSDYYHKYPFGTVHYLMALMAEEGITVELPELDVKICVETGSKQTLFVSPGEVILRADDALYSTLSAYRDNALDWWDWLDHKHESAAIESLRGFIDFCDKSKAHEYKDIIGRFFKSLGCDGIDGSFKNITDANGCILPKVLEYSQIISKIVKFPLTLPSK